MNPTAIQATSQQKLRSNTTRGAGALALLALALGLTAVSGCHRHVRKTPAEKAGDKIENAGDKIEDKLDEAD